MDDTYLRTPVRMTIDRAMAALGRAGLAPGGVASLTVVGRRSGAARTAPVTPVQVGGRVHLVAPYGVVGWVRNLREAGEATIQRGRSTHRVRATELPPSEAAPVLREYLRRVPLVQPHVAAAPEDPMSAFEEIADRHPVFLIERIG